MDRDGLIGVKDLEGFIGRVNFSKFFVKAKAPSTVQPYNKSKALDTAIK